MSIFKDSFRPYVRDQLALREELINIGNTPRNNPAGIRTSRNSRNDLVLHSDNDLIDNKNISINPGTFYNYALNKQCIIRMTSLVDYVENVNLEIGGLEGEQSFKALRGASLSQNFILEGGVVSDFARTKGQTREVRRVSTPRDSFPRLNQRTNLGYGDLAIGADASDDGYGIVPMPGIIDANIRTKSAYGSLREAKVNFECHNRRQLEVLEMLYMRPGYMVALEWGWNPYINNDGKLITQKRLLEDYFADDEGKNSRIYTNNITQQEVFNAVNDLKEYHCGNYDGFLGFVKNFGFQARDDGGFTCYTELVSIGEVLESLRIPSLSITDPIISVNDNNTSNSNSNITIKTTKIDTTYTGGSSYTMGAGGGSTTTVSNYSLDSTDYNNALNEGIFPQYNGLLGLVKSLSNYCTFNSFSQRKTHTTYITEAEQQKLEDIFGFNDTEAIESLEEGDTQRVALEAQAKTASKVQRDANYFGTINLFLRDLVRYQSATLEKYLIKVLGLKNAEELRNYIIPVNDSNIKILAKNTQPYIRWDALVALINENLITKDAKGDNPVQLITDRIYSQGNKTSKLDPLLFTGISDFTNTSQNNIFDYSCDSNICILPLQFELGKVPDSTMDKFNIAETLGYVPDITQFPSQYIVGSYGHANTTLYDNKDIFSFITSNNINATLNDTDKLRRIGSIFLNVNMINDIAEKNADDEEYTLGKFINDIWKEVNKVCPNHNFVVTDDKESNKVFIIDLPVDNSEIPKEIYQFIPYSNKNILRKFEYTSNVPKAMSATVAIQAQDPRSIQDIDGVTFAAFNRSIKNRILSNDSVSNWRRTQAQIANNMEEFEKKQVQLKVQMNKHLQRFFSNLTLTAKDKKPISEGNMVGITKEYQKNATYLSQALNRSSTFTSVIPLDFSATLDGISGIVIGNIFRVEKSRLPRAYANANIGFIVFNEEQTITAGQDWTTDIGGKMTILPDPSTPVKINGITTVTFAAEAANLFEPGTEAYDSATTALSEYQDAVTDIGQATTGDELYLKRVKDNSIQYLDVAGGPDIDMTDGNDPDEEGEKGLLPYKFNENNTIGKTFGFVSVRRTPGIDNEGTDIDFGFDSNNYVGMFDAFANAGLFLGFIKAQGGNYDPVKGTITEDGQAGTGMHAQVITEKGGGDRGRVRLLPSTYKHYFNLDEESISPTDLITFIPQKVDGSSTVSIEGKEYYTITKPLVENTDQSSIVVVGTKGNLETRPKQTVLSTDLTTPRYIAKEHCTRIQHIWYNIQFSPEAELKFLNGWSRQYRSGYNGKYSGVLNTDTADERITYGTLSEKSKPETITTQYLENKAFWMRDDVLAASAASAKDPGNFKVFKNNLENP